MRKSPSYKIFSPQAKGEKSGKKNRDDSPDPGSYNYDKSMLRTQKSCPRVVFSKAMRHFFTTDEARNKNKLPPVGRYDTFNDKVLCKKTGFKKKF